MSLAMSPQFETSLTALFSASALPLPLLSRLLTVLAWALAAGSGAAVAGLAEVDVDGSDAVERALGEGDVAADDRGRGGGGRGRPAPDLVGLRGVVAVTDQHEGHYRRRGHGGDRADGADDQAARARRPGTPAAASRSRLGPCIRPSRGPPGPMDPTGPDGAIVACCCQPAAAAAAGAAARHVRPAGRLGVVRDEARAGPWPWPAAASSVDG